MGSLRRLARMLLAAAGMVCLPCLPLNVSAEEAPRKKLIALTFDDGPSVYTGRILDALEAHGARATFFVQGDRVGKYSDEVRRAVAIGCEVAGHGWNHSELSRLSNGDLTGHLLRTQQAILDATGVEPPMLYRAPYGSTGKRMLEISAELGFMLIDWTFLGDSTDEASKTSEIIPRRAHHGAIVLCHDIRLSTAKAMQTAIPELIARGYELVTVSELLEAAGQPVVPGAVWKGLPKPRREE